MGKTQHSWSGMRHWLEQEMLAESLRGRVRYACTTYPGMDLCGVFSVFVDDRAVKHFSMETVASALREGDDPVERQAFWDAYWNEKTQTPLCAREEFDDEEFAEALKIYRASSIAEAIASEHPVVRMFAMLDRRAGKRTLSRLVETVPAQPEWLQAFYRLRLNAEGIN